VTSWGPIVDRELEDRLERALAALPDGGPGARERALRAAVASLPEPARRGGGSRRLTALLAAALLALVAGGGALAAIGRLDVRLGSGPEPPAASAAAPGRALIPRGADGFATLAGGRLWLATRTGLGVEGLATSAAALSPHALYVAVGIGPSLVAMSPDGRRAWTHRTPGPVVAAAWAPNPILIAYVVRAGDRYQLRLIEGNGEGDVLLDRDVAPVAPSWRSDSFAIAYVGRGGRPAVHDRFAGRRTAVAACRGTGPVRALVFAPGGGAGVPAEGWLALATGRGAFVAGTATGSGGCRRLEGATAVSAVAWLSSSDLVVADGAAGHELAAIRRYRVSAAGARALGVATLPMPPRALAAAPDGRGIALLTERSGRPEVWLADPPPARASAAPVRARAVLLRVPAGRAAAERGAPVASTLGWR
jgi:hypothetical protein